MHPDRPPSARAHWRRSVSETRRWPQHAPAWCHWFGRIEYPTRGQCRLHLIPQAVPLRRQHHPPAVAGRKTQIRRARPIQSPPRHPAPPPLRLHAGSQIPSNSPASRSAARHSALIDANWCPRPHTSCPGPTPSRPDAHGSDPRPWHPRHPPLLYLEFRYLESRSLRRRSCVIQRRIAGIRDMAGQML